MEDVNEAAIERDPSNAEFFGLLMQLIERVKAHVLAAAEDYGLSVPQCLALWTLRDGEPAPMRALADHMRCDPSNVTGIVDRLEAMQLLERRVDAEDRRVKTLLLTDKGERVRNEIVERVGDELVLMMQMSPSERAQFTRLLRKTLAASS